jgi:Asp-tRNA(Asn)/Glu-tRNA(Gln) amidotransferase C subunit
VETNRPDVNQANQHEKGVTKMKVKVYEKDVAISKKYIADIVGQLFEESYYLWRSEWFRKDEVTETLLARKIMATEQVVWKALEEYFKNNK